MRSPAQDPRPRLPDAIISRGGGNQRRLFQDTATHIPIGFLGSLAQIPGSPWLAMAGVDVAKMQRRAGHDSIETTMGYVKTTEDLSGNAGTPFAELPASLIRPNDWPSDAASPQETRPILGSPSRISNRDALAGQGV